MKILLDECLPKLLKRNISGHEVATVSEMGWAGAKNGELLNLAESVFDVLVTVDRSIQHQQNIQARQIALVVLIASNTKLDTLRPLVPALLKALETVHAGDVVQISA